MLKNFIPFQLSLKIPHKNDFKITSMVCNWCLPRIVTIDSFCIFNTKYYINVLYLNKKLFIFGKTDTKLCSFCKLDDETTLHLFANCTKTNILWANIKEFCDENLKLPSLVFQMSINIFFSFKSYFIIV